MRRFSALLLLVGAATLAFVTTGSAWSKISIVESAFGIMLVLSGAFLLNGESRPFSFGRWRWISYIPLIAGVSLGFLSPAIIPAATAIAFAATLTLIYLLSGAQDVSSRYIVVVSLVVTTAISLNYFYYYPFDTGIDSWGYLSVASGILQTSHYTGLAQPAWPTSRYYFPFPIMSIVAAIISAVTGLSLPVSLVIFPSALIILQPLIVYLLSLRIFGNPRAAAFSAFILITESAMVELIHSPMAESVALSMMFIVMLMLCDRTPSGSRKIIAFAIFLVTAALHALVAIVGLVLLWYLILKRNQSQTRTILPLSLILVGYLGISGAAATVAATSYLSFQTVINFLVEQSLPSGLQVFPTGTPGIFFIWWGLPVALALCSIFIRKIAQARNWAVSGLALLGVSFAVNLVAPDLDSARFGGLIAWITLAVGGGITMKSLTRTSRQLLILAPLISLVCLSAVISPTLTPQFGFIQLSPAPTTATDRIALDWANLHLGRNQVIVADASSAAYSIFSQYQAGHFSDASVLRFADILGYPINQNLEHVLFVRWSNTGPNTGQTCASTGPFLSQHQFNIIYNNYCDVLVGGI